MEFRRKIVQVDPGTEPYLAWALRRVRVLDALRAGETMSRVSSPAPNVLVFMDFAGGAWRIRVTGGSAGRTRRLNTADGEGAALRWYHVRGGLDGYAEAARTASSYNKQEVMSLDGSTLAYCAVGSADVKAMRKQKAVATYTRSTRNGLTAEQQDWLTHGVMVDLQPSDPRYDIARSVWDVLTFNFGLSSAGKRLYVSDIEPTIGTRQVTALDVSTTSTSTALAQVWQSGVPQFVTDFYASLTAIPHTLHASAHASLDQVPDALAFNPDTLIPGSGIGAHWLALPRRFAPLPGGTYADTSGLQVFPAWDPFHAAPLLVVTMPYASALSKDAGTNYVITVGERREIRRLDTKSLTWTLVEATDRPAMVVMTYGGAPTVPYTINGVQVLGGANNVAGPDYGATLLPAIGLDLPPTNAALRNASVTVLGKVFSKPAGYDTLLNVARDAVYVSNGSTGHVLWAGATWSHDFAAPLANSPVFSPHGELMWTGKDSAGWDYYELGVLKQHFAAAPAADASSFASYGASSPAGFWFVKDVVGWRYDKPTTAKAVVYKTVKAPSTIAVAGGTLVIDGIGSASVPATPSAPYDGFSLDGTLYWSLGTSYTKAQLAVIYGVSASAVHYNLDLGNQYTVSAGSYQWITATVDLRYATGALKVAKTYSSKATSIKVRGNFGPGTIATSDAELIQDYLLFRKV